MKNPTKPLMPIASVALSSLLFACGCGGAENPNYPTVTLAGSVQVDGASLERGRIRFSPMKPDQAPAAESAIVAGRYTVTNAPIGKVLVTLAGSKKTGRMIEMFGEKREESLSAIPPKYSLGIPIDVGNHDNDSMNFDLTSK